MYVAIRAGDEDATFQAKRTGYGSIYSEKGQIDATLAPIQEISDEHFSVRRDEFNYGGVRIFAYFAEILKRITDSAFHEGEFDE